VEWTIDFLEEERVVKATTSGAITFTGSLALAGAISARLRAESAAKFLVDHRAAKVALSVGELYFLVADAEKAGIIRAYTGAIVLPSEAMANYQFFETRSANIGFVRRAFADIKAALEWLSTVPSS
jgi:hypothetical protein